MITSTSNPQVKNLQQLSRKAKLRNEQDVFLVEGTKMYLEHRRSGSEKSISLKVFMKRKERAL